MRHTNEFQADSGASDGVDFHQYMTRYLREHCRNELGAHVDLLDEPSGLARIATLLGEAYKQSMG